MNGPVEKIPVVDFQIDPGHLRVINGGSADRNGGGDAIDYSNLNCGRPPAWGRPINAAKHARPGGRYDARANGGWLAAQRTFLRLG
jgi:hypothetical protein